MRYAVVLRRPVLAAPVLGLSLLLAGCGGTPAASGGSSSAACVTPQLSASPPAAAPGTTLRVTGRYFFDDCHDMMVNGEPRPEPKPLTGLVLLLRQGDRTWTLADHVDAADDPDFTIDATVTVPADLGTGAAALMVRGHGEPVVLTIAAPPGARG